MKKILAILVAGTMVFSLAACGSSSSSSSSSDDWPESGLGAMLPVPDFGNVEIIEDSDEEFEAEITKASEDNFSSYKEACIDLGFDIDSSGYETMSYSAGYEGGYDLDLYYDDKTLHVTLEAPIEFTELNWPTIGLATALPTPDSTMGYISIDSSIQFYAYIQCSSHEEYDAYVSACQDAGYVVDFSNYDDVYDADNDIGYSLRLEYIEYKGCFTISMYDNSDELEDTEEEATEEVEESEDESEEAEETESTETTEASNRTGVSDDFQQSMDSYEAFIDEYVEFMEEYADSDNTTAMLAEYSEYMEKYTQAMEDFEAIEDQDMTDEELALYTEVQLRCSEKLLSVAY